LGVLFLLALESLLKEGVRFRRPIIFSAVPDEEPGGENGMRWLVENRGKDLDPQWVWDEGGAGLRDVFGSGILFPVAVAEKQICRVRLVAAGETGHGSIPHPNNANTILLTALQRVITAPRPLRAGRVAAEMFAALAPKQAFPASLLLGHLDNPLVLMLAGRSLAADNSPTPSFATRSASTSFRAVIRSMSSPTGQRPTWIVDSCPTRTGESFSAGSRVGSPTIGFISREPMHRPLRV
jgi:acetylornithine deacetylase/succinyl-diaminopimelate desuccinylase-like protein